MDPAIKGAIFLVLMILVGFRYLAKTGEENFEMTAVDGWIAVLIVVAVVLMNL